MSLFILTGGSGFIGGHMLSDLLTAGHEVRALTRDTKGRINAPGLQWIDRDAADRSTWDRLLEPDTVVLNLGYSNAVAGREAVAATATMIRACAHHGIRRFIHCSTASVYGANTEALIGEDSACLPANEYGRVKMAIEQELQTAGSFPTIILRPTVVFGHGGDALQKMADDLRTSSSIKNWLRASLYGRRHTHLVAVETVVAAMRFTANAPMRSNLEVFNVSDDSDAQNDFSRVEQIAREELALARQVTPRIPVPAAVLEAMLRLRHGYPSNTRCRYDDTKLAARGFTAPVKLESALRNFFANIGKG